MATTVFETPAESQLAGKADKVSNATNGNVATLDGNGNLVDSGKTIGTSVPSNAVFTDTTYSAATQSVDGLMSASDKTKLDGVETGANKVTKTSQLTNDSGFLTSHTPMADIANIMYPVGAIYISTVSTSPATLFGIGTWSQIKGSFLYACEDTGITAGTTGGAKSVSYTPAGSVGNHTLTTTEIPSHSHGLNSHKHSIGAHSHGLNSHTHTGPSHTHEVGAHAHGLNSHKHSVGAHAHGLNSHTHGVGTYATGDKGAHDHYMNYVMANYWQGGTSIALGSGSSSMRYYGDSGTRPVTEAVGNHNHTISGSSAAATGNTANSTAFDSGAASGNTANSTAFNSGSAGTGATGAATGSTANSTAFDSGAASGNTESSGGGGAHNHGFTGTAASIATMPPYLAVYMWKRTA